MIHILSLPGGLGQGMTSAWPPTDGAVPAEMRERRLKGVKNGEERGENHQNSRNLA